VAGKLAEREIRRKKRVVNTDWGGNRTSQPDPKKRGIISYVKTARRKGTTRTLIELENSAQGRVQRKRDKKKSRAVREKT